MTLDERGLHKLDSGFVYAVRRRVKGRRSWFKSESGAVSRAEYWCARGEAVAVLRYSIGDEEEIL